MAPGQPTLFPDIYDDDVYEYRRQKEILQRRICTEIRKNDTATKHSAKTSEGWLDLYIYYPRKRTCNSVTFNFHGGGFCLDYWELDAPYCRMLADKTGSIVVNVDYFVSPEYKYPLSYATAYEAICWCSEHASELGLPLGHFLVCGSSAGANLSAGLVQLSQTDTSPVAVSFKGLMMNYPALRMQMDSRQAIDPNKAIAPKRMLQYMAWQYTDLEQMKEPLASPVFAGDDIKWPDTLMNIAGYDSLKQEAEEFRDKLENEGTYVDYCCYPEAEHGFTHASLKEYREADAADAWDRIALFICAH